MKLSHRFGGALAVAAVVLSTASVAAPAHAAPGDATLTFAPTAVLNDGTCVDHAFSYSVEIPEGTTTWTLDVKLVGPDNEQHDSQLIGSFAQDAPAGSEALQLCSLFEPTGTYTILTTVDYKVGGASTVWGTQTVEGTFQVVRAAKSKVGLKAKRHGVKVSAVAKVGVSTGGDYGPVAAGGKVTFEKKVGRRWKKVDSATTDAAGVARAKFKATKGTVVRAVFAGAGEVLVGSGMPVPAATSKPVKLR